MATVFPKALQWTVMNDPKVVTYDAKRRKNIKRRYQQSQVSSVTGSF
jgi:hypothetical protein